MGMSSAVLALAVGSFAMGVVIGMHFPSETHEQRMVRDKAEFEMFMRAAPFICGKDGCGNW